MPEDFVSPGVDLPKVAADYGEFATRSRDALIARWSTPEGQSILRSLRDANFERSAIEGSVGKLLGRYDLRCIPLQNQKLRQVDLSACDLFSADFTNADCWNADFRESYLSEAVFTGTDLSWVKVKETLVDNVKINHDTKLLGIDISGLNTNFALDFIAEIRDQQRIYELRERHPWFAEFLRITSDYGRSLLRWSVWTLGVIIGFGLVFSLWPDTVKGSSGGLDGIYFSVVTFTTLGFGDIYPVTVLGKVLVMAEVVVGYIMGGVFIAILTRRVLG